MGALTEQRSAVDPFTRAEQDESLRRPELVPLAAHLLPMNNPLDRSDLAASSQGPRPDTGALAGRTRPRRDRADPHGVSRPATLRAAARLRELLMVADKQICMFERWLIEHVAGITDSEHGQADPTVRHLGCAASASRAGRAQPAHRVIKADSVPSHWAVTGKTASAASCDGICALLSQRTVQQTRRDEGRRRVKSARGRAGQLVVCPAINWL